MVASRVAAIPELIEDGVNGLLVPPDDPAGAGGGARPADRRSGAAPAARPGRPGPGADRLRHERRHRSPGGAPARRRSAGRPGRGMSSPARVLCAAEAARPSDPVGRPADGARSAAGAGASRPVGRAREPATQLRPRAAMPVRQRRIEALGERSGSASAAALPERSPAARPRAWLTYHAYHKSPDWLGPAVADALGIPYLLVEASFAPKQAGGPWRAATPPASGRSAGPTWCW